ncbi:DUF881 domain-containing protein [Jatrophihabitans endophyticus]|uniref:DUF881 domain-containing protein n=1 Tax=Jatrophihabitans endophyticus TaxID=1206085 RepID=UPI0019F8F8D0|nr:DUF881 domain-containing protein [Jatrophihabitans endophyticus]MBE7186758.1 DUF881 domain-containing protein [Jatrophihabitans endophyticus]
MSTPARPPRNPGAQFLQELLENSLDPGYEAAARRKAAAPPEPDRARSRRGWEQVATALGCLLAGFVVVVAYVHTHRGAPAAARVHQQLVQKVQAGEQADHALGTRVEQDTRQLARAQRQALPASGALGALRRQLTRAQLAAGTVAVHGPGLTVTLREPPTPSTTDAVGRGGSTPLSATNILTDRDLRSVANELWADGAEAVSVNGIRLTPTSAIRFAGDAVLVDFQPISSPYTIDAVGNADRLATRFASSAVAGRYQTLVSADGIGFTFTDEDDLSLPAGAQADPRYASAVPSPSPTASGR